MRIGCPFSLVKTGTKPGLMCAVNTVTTSPSRWVFPPIPAMIHSQRNIQEKFCTDLWSFLSVLFFFFSSPALCPAKSGYLDFSASCLFQFNSTNLLGFTWIPNVCTLAGNSFDEVSQNNHTDSLICFLVSMITALCCLMYSISQTIVLIYFVQF